MASVKVAVRVRPFNQRELEMKSIGIIEMEEKKTIITNVKISPSAAEGEPGRCRLKEFTFDHSYWSCNTTDPHFASQEQVFEDLGKEVVESAFEGYNACIFAYGQTGSGKTYTMMGTPDSEGLIPRICEALFAKMKINRNLGATFRTEVSYLEIYNERVKDLLRKKASQHNLRVREHPKLGIYVQDLSRHLVMDYSDVQELMTRGNSHRTTAATAMNDVSSRSHAIFTLTFSQANFSHDMPSETMSKVNLVDLAGSERAGVTGATGQRLKEGGHINKSLVTLGTVISALADMSSSQSKKQVFIPYRDSVLTWLLKDSLGGNSKTIMIATVSPAECNYGETLSTLRYANRAKNIINKPTINEDPNVKLIRELRNEIAHLKSLLGDSINTSPTMIEKLHENEARVKVLTEEWTERWKETHKILKEQRTLGLRKSGQGVVLDSELPHLIGIDDDVLSTGITLYHLKEGITSIGTEKSSVKQDIVLNGLGIEDEHCIIDLQNGKAILTPLGKAECFVNTICIDKATHLSQGCVILLGKTNMFRYNDPAEVERLRKEKERGSSLNLSRLSLLSRSASDLARSIENLNSPMQEVEHHKGKDWELLEKKRQHIEQLEKEYYEAEERRQKEQLETEAELERKRKELDSIRKTNEDLYQKAQQAQKLALEEQAKLDICSQNIQKQLKEYSKKEINGAQQLQQQEEQLMKLRQQKQVIEEELRSLVEMREGRLSSSSPVHELMVQVKEEVEQLEAIQNELDEIQSQDMEDKNNELNSTLQTPNDSSDLKKHQQEMSNIFNKLKQETIKRRDACREQIEKDKKLIIDYKKALLQKMENANENDISRLADEKENLSDREESLLQKEQDMEDVFQKKLNSLEEIEKHFLSKTAELHNFQNNKPLPEKEQNYHYKNDFDTIDSEQKTVEKSSEILPLEANIKKNFTSTTTRKPNEPNSPFNQTIYQKGSTRENTEYLNGSENFINGRNSREDLNDKIITMQYVEDQFHRLQQDLEKRRKAFEEERLQELDHIELEKFHLQEMEQQKRINCLVEQEVQRRLFEEKIRLEKQYMEQGLLQQSHRRDLMNFQQHFESRFPDDPVPPNIPYVINVPLEDELFDKPISISIPSYTMRGSGSGAHYEYEVKIYVSTDNWTIYRRYKRFRELHHYMRLKYGDKVMLPYFPPRKIFGSKSERVVEERRNHLQIYLNKLVETCMKIECSPLFHPDGQAICKQDMYDFAPFFHKGCFETSKHGTG